MWMPIETAPKDGTVIDLWDAAYEYRICDCQWIMQSTEGYWVRRDGHCAEIEVVTHWMPLPEPPK